MKNNSFKRWLETFISEKEIDTEQILSVPGPSGINHIPIGCLIEKMLIAPNYEQEKIKETIVKIDFMNGNVIHFFTHLAKAIAI